MRHDLYLAWRYLVHYPGRAVVLVLCLAITAALPLGLHSVLNEAQRQLLQRAESTPLLVGPRGSAVDLAVNLLAFHEPPALAITMAESERVASTKWADALPIYYRLRIQGQPLIGVTPDYFEFRRLATVKGRLPAVIGECVLGAAAARALRLDIGDSLIARPVDAFDLAASYPLRLRIVGLLATAGSADDQAIFVDLQTTWIIDGLGHGHSDASATAGSTFAPAPATYQDITPENIATFHFHGDPANYPISAVIAVPRDQRTATLLRGRYLGPELTTDVVQPTKVVQGLFRSVLRISAAVDAVLLIAAVATTLTVGLVFALSIRLREGEIRTVEVIGGTRMKMARIIGAELVLLGTVTALVSGFIIVVLRGAASQWLSLLLPS